MLTLTDNAEVVLEKRYLLRDSEGRIVENPEGLFRRVARFIAEGDLKYGKLEEEVKLLTEEFYRLMSSMEFLPNSPTLMNAGKPGGGQLSACFVLPVEDSLEAIFDTLKHAALIHQSGGGTGFSFSRLRPKGDVLRYTSGITSGPLSFMEVYNAATEAIKQGGTRRGANMGVLRVDHPDIEDFITVKNDLTRLTNFNISVGVTDAFMEAVKSNGKFALIHPKDKKKVREVEVRDLMRKIAESAWKTGEPGLLFIDRINADNVTPLLGDIESTNPCGEVPLLPYEACNLGSVNMGKMLIRKPNQMLAEGIDWEYFRRTIRLGVHFLDNVITQNRFPLSEIKTMTEGNRKIGLGLMGWADSLMALGIPYDSDEAIVLAEKVMAFIYYHSKMKSAELARDRGRFLFFEKSVFTKSSWFSERFGDSSIPPHPSPLPHWGRGSKDHLQWDILDKEVETYGLRNATTVSLAPTGTISIIAAASGGIEPLYALTFVRHIMNGTELLEVNPVFADVLRVKGLYSDELISKIIQRGGIKEMYEIPTELKRLFVTAYDIEPFCHVLMQSAFQKYSDNAVSKTINFPESATPDDILETYQLAYSMGLKGITVYRNNSRKLQPMALGKISGEIAKIVDSQYCPDCKKPLQWIEGCFQCPDCQYSYCG